MRPLPPMTTIFIFLFMLLLSVNGEPRRFCFLVVEKHRPIHSALSCSGKALYRRGCECRPDRGRSESVAPDGASICDAQVHQSNLLFDPELRLLVGPEDCFRTV